MSDTVTTQSGTLATIPTSTVIATDDAGAGGHVQLVKLAISTDGSATPLTADNTDGLLVNLGSNNDVTLATLPDTAAGDLAAINAALGGTLTVDLGANNDVTLATLPDTAAGDLAAINSAVSGTLTVGSHAVTNAGTFVVQENGAALTALQLIDDIVATDDTSTHSTGTTKGAVIMAAATPTDGSVDANDIGAIAMSTDRRLLVDAQIAGQDADITIADGGNSITIDGTVTANLSATDNAVLDSIDTAVNGTLTVGSHAVTNAGTFAVQVDAALPAGDNNIGNVDIASSVALDVSAATVPVAGVAAHDAAVSGNPVLIGAEFDDTTTDTVDEGDVGRLRINDRRALYTTFETPAGDSPWDDTNDALQVNIVAGSSSGTEYTEDDAAAANPSGGAVILVRQDTPAGLTSLDGDNLAQRGTDYGAAFVQVVDSSGNFIDTFGGSGGTAAADDADFTAGTTQGTLIQGVYESSPTSVTDGDMGAVGITSTRSMKVEETNSAAILADTAAMDTNLGTIAGAVSGSEMQVDIVSDGAGLLTTAAHDAAFGTAGSADTQVRTVQGIASMTPLLVDATGQGDVPITLAGESVAVTNAGTFATQVDGDALTALQLIDDAIYADDADWTADTSKHVLVGGVTQSVPSANTDGDTTPLVTNLLRELRLAALESDLAAASTSHTHKYYTATTPTDGIIWSPAAGKRWYLTHLSINVSAASTVTVEDDLAGGDDPIYKAEFAANSGVVLTFPEVPLFSGEDAADLTITATAGTVYVTAVGYEI